MIRELMWSAWEKPGLGYLRLAVRESGVVADGAWSWARRKDARSALPTT